MFASGKSASVSAVANYIEDVFSTWLYTGSSSAQTITNGIDLLNKGGLVWLKGRNVGSASGYGDHELFDSANVGSTRKYLRSDGTDALGINGSIAATPFTASGFNLDAGPEINNNAGDTNVSWTFRKQPKFFDIVTYTGNGTSGRTVAHNLGSVPGCMIVKKTNNTGQWCVYHRGLTTPATDVIFLNLTNAQTADPNVWNSTAPTSTVFTLGNSTGVNNNGDTYVAYLFAHDAGGFGLTGNDNVISCGSFTDTSGAVNLGYEPQFFLYKSSTNSDNWIIVDTMRGLTGTGSTNPQLYPNTTASETSGFTPYITATGFQVQGVTAGTYIYIAIRRGPMKVPTDGTSVYGGVTYTGDGTNNRNVNANFSADLVLGGNRSGLSTNGFYDRLRGPARLATDSTAAEVTASLNGEGVFTNTQNGMAVSSGGNGAYNSNGIPEILNFFRRAPGFFDEVCYTGTGAGSGSFALNHNLSTAPELIILRQRNGTSSWQAGTNFTSTNWRSMFLNLTNAGASQTSYASNDWFAAQPTAATFTVGWPYYTAGTYVAYFFASAPGVSKVGSYTGNGSNQTINCGFTGGARFVLIKRTDSTGDWYVWDTARGIVSGNDPRLSLNTTAAEVTTDDSVDTDSTGFVVNQLSATNINVTSATYIFLAIA